MSSLHSLVVRLFLFFARFAKLIGRYLHGHDSGSPNDEGDIVQEEENVGSANGEPTTSDNGGSKTVYGSRPVERRDISADSMDSAIGHMESPKLGAVETIINSVKPVETEMADLNDKLRSPPTPASQVRIHHRDSIPANEAVLREPRGRKEGQTSLTVNDNGHRRAGQQYSLNGAHVSGSSLNSTFSRAQSSERMFKNDANPPSAARLPRDVPKIALNDGHSSIESRRPEDDDRRDSKRLSVSPFVMERVSRRSSARLSKTISTSSEQLIARPGVDDDRRFSTAATLDEFSDEDDDIGSLPAGSDADLSELGLELTAPDMNLGPGDHKPAEVPNMDVGNEGTVSDVTDALRDRKPVEVATSDTEKQASEDGTRTRTSTLTKEALPPALSTVALSFRTDEWAKHLGDAEIPTLEDLRSNQSTDEAVNPETDESPAPVNIRELRQTAHNALPPPAPRRVSAQPSSQQRPLLHPGTSSVRLSFQPSRSTLNIPRTRSPDKRASSQEPLAVVWPGPHARMSRTFTSPALNPRPAVAGPIRSFTNPPDEVPLASPSPTYYTPRTSMSRSSSAYTNIPSTPEIYVSHSDSDAGYIQDGEDATAAARQAMSRENALRLLNSHSPLPQPPRPMRQLQRQPSWAQVEREKEIADARIREQRMDKWQTSLKIDLRKSRTSLAPMATASVTNAGNDVAIMEEQRARLLQDRDEAARKKDLERRRSRMNEERMGDAMRGSGMMEAHREAMRKMQKGVRLN